METTEVPKSKKVAVETKIELHKDCKDLFVQKDKFRNDQPTLYKYKSKILYYIYLI